MKKEELEKWGNEQFLEKIAKFQRQMDAHRSTYPFSRNVLVAKFKLANRKLEEYISKNSILTIKDGEDEVYRIPMALHRDFIKYQQELECASLAIQNISRNTVVAMVGCYDALVGDMIRILMHVKPEVLQSCGAFISASELFTFPTIKDAEDYFIEKQVESILRGSHEEQLTWIANKIGVKTCKEYPHFPDFIEITERRNLFVHAEGKVSQSYITKCTNARNALTAKVGDVLDASPQYVLKCHDVLMETGVKLSQVIWRKLNIGIEFCDESMQNITFDCLTSHQYTLAQDLLSYATTDVKKYSSEEYSWIYRVNHALSYYLAGDKAHSDSIVKAKDWSALDVKYRLAEAVLLENDERARELMLRIGNRKDFQGYYQQWPLFRKFRQKEIFKSTYEEIYKTPFIYQEPKDANWKDFLAEAQDMLNDEAKK